MNRTSGVLGRAGVTATIVALATAGIAISASPASAAPLPIRNPVFLFRNGPSNTQPVKSVTVTCPRADQVVLGGSGRIIEASTPTHRIALTELEPSTNIQTPNGARQGYTAAAASTDPNLVVNWAVEVRAVCADAIAGHHIVFNATTNVTAEKQETNVSCPDGERVLGSGARVGGPVVRGLGLQIARPDILGGLTRAQAQETVPNSVGNWNLVAWAVCAPTPAGYDVNFGRSTLEGSETVKTALATCDDGLRLIGAGGAITNVAPGSVALEDTTILNLTTARATAVENRPTSASWDFIVAAAICATAVTT